MKEIENSTVLRIAIVVDTFDENDGKRIKVRLLPEEARLSVSELPYAFPLLPKMVHVMPKVGEAVLILTAKLDNTHSQRFYLGPIIHQPQFMNFDSYELGATTLLDGGVNSPSIAPSYIPDSIGSFPKDEDIALVGRKDTDIILGEDDLRIRCGVHLTDSGDDTKVEFNKTTPSYIKLKHHNTPLNDNSNSTATIVSENINLISTIGSPYIETSNKDELITDDAINKILEEAHVLPYGDILVKFLKIFITAFKNHTHAYSGLPPVQDISYNTLEDFDLNDILSKNIRIN